MEQVLVLCRDAGNYLSVLMTMDNKRDYDCIQRLRTSSHVLAGSTMKDYMERASKRTHIYKDLRHSLHDVILEHEWTNLKQIKAYLNKAYFERIADDIGEILA